MKSSAKSLGMIISYSWKSQQKITIRIPHAFVHAITGETFFEHAGETLFPIKKSPFSGDSHRWRNLEYDRDSDEDSQDGDAGNARESLAHGRVRSAVAGAGFWTRSVTGSVC